MPRFQSRQARNIIFAITGLLLVVSVSIATIFILKTASPSEEKKTQPVATVTPQEIIDSYSADKTIPALSADAYQLSDNIGQGFVTYKANNHEYTVNVPTDVGVMFQAKSRTQADKTKLITEQTADFMQTKDMHIATQPPQAEFEATIDTTYENSSLICQLRTIVSDEISTASYTLSCVDKKAVDKEYKTVEQLIGLYDTADSLGSFTKATRMVTTEDNLSAATLGLTKTDASFTMLLFVSENNKWQFVADLTDGDSGQSNGKYVQSEALIKAYDNPTYGSFLKKHF